MGYINILVGSDAKIHIKDKQLFLEKLNTSEEIDYPLEDINSIVIESQQSIISTKTITDLAEHNIATFFCDQSHLPNTQVLSFNGHYKNLLIYNIQTQCPKPLQKRLWQSIIKQKISNQAKALNLCNIKNDIDQLVSQVSSGDTNNIESVAALKYFKLMFGKDFSRNQISLINSALDYGYSIIRGAIARSVVAHGLITFLGLHHCNQLNAFNLVDDLIEPFRPIVDLFVFNNFADSQENELNRNMKQSLIGLLNADVLVSDKKYSLSYAVDMMVSSFVDSMSKNINKLLLPDILPFELHKYE